MNCPNPVSELCSDGLNTRQKKKPNNVCLCSSSLPCATHVFSPSRASMHPVPQLSPKVDVMVLYTKQAWALHGLIASEDVLISMITVAWEESNDAMANSRIPLYLNLVYLDRVSV